MSYSYGRARLAIDEYSENRKKADYTRELLKEWEDAVNDARDDSLLSGLLGGMVGLLAGDTEDMYLGFNIGKELGFHASYELGAGDIMDDIMSYEDEIGNVKFNQAEFEDTLIDIQSNTDNFIDNERDATMWTVINSLATYGKMGGYEEGGPGTKDLTIQERMAFNLKEFFGVDTPITVPKGFKDELDWLNHIETEIKAGKTINQVLTRQQQFEILGQDRGATIFNFLTPPK